MEKQFLGSPPGTCPRSPVSKVGRLRVKIWDYNTTDIHAYEFQIFFEDKCVFVDLEFQRFVTNCVVGFFPEFWLGLPIMLKISSLPRIFFTEL